MYYHIQKTSLERVGSNIDSKKWLKNKKATINPQNNDDNCFQYDLIIALNNEKKQKTKTIQKEYQKLSLLLISMIGKRLSFHYTQKTGKSLN